MYPNKQFSRNLAEASEIRKKRRVNNTYYNEKNALIIKQVLDRLLEDPQNVARWNWTDFTSVTQNVLKLKIYNGWNYLIDYLDPEGKYLDLRSSVQLTTDEQGLVTRRSPSIGSAIVFKELPSTPTGDSTPWRKQVVDFLEDSLQKKLVLTNLNLSKSDEEWIHSQVDQTKEITQETILCVTKPHEIKMLRS